MLYVLQPIAILGSLVTSLHFCSSEAHASGLGSDSGPMATIGKMCASTAYGIEQQAAEQHAWALLFWQVLLAANCPTDVLDAEKCLAVHFAALRGDVVLFKALFG
jgi:hypothetical protein